MNHPSVGQELGKLKHDYDKLQREIRQSTEKAEAELAVTLARHPAAALGIAAGLGFVLGLLVTTGRRARVRKGGK